MQFKINCLDKKKIDVDCIKVDKKESIKTKLILQTPQRFKSERHNNSTEKINKIALRSSDNNRMQSIDSIESYAYEISKDLICNKEKLNAII